MKRLLEIVLVLILAFSLSACGGSSTQTPISTNNDNPQTTESGSSSEPKDNDSSANTAVTIESTVLLDRDGVIITAKELVYDSIWGVGVKVLVENNSQKNLGVQCNDLIVNNYMISDMFSSTVAAGKKSNETIYLSSSGLEAAGIKTISDIVMSFNVFDSDSYNTLFDTDEIEIRTSAYGAVEQVAMDDGKELYNRDGIRIIGKYVQEDSFWGAGVLLYIENNYKGNVIVQCDNMSVNGFMVTPYFYCTVNSGRMALSNITIMSSDLEKNDIKSVEDIELIFKIIDSDTYQTIIESEPILFTTK